MDSKNYITIQGFMVNDLHLKGNELIIYAVIYGFSQTDGQWFTGSHQYLADWAGCTKRSVINALSNLLDNKLIEKNEKTIHGIKFVDYRVTIFTGGENFSLGGEKSLPNNIINNIERKESIINNTKEKKFTKPTLEEVKAYCIERKNGIDAQSFIDFYESKGWKVGNTPMKDWKAAIRTWERRNKGIKTTNFSEREYSTEQIKSIFDQVPNIEDYDI